MKPRSYNPLDYASLSESHARAQRGLPLTESALIARYVPVWNSIVRALAITRQARGARRGAYPAGTSCTPGEAARRTPSRAPSSTTCAPRSNLPSLSGRACSRCDGAFFAVATVSRARDPAWRPAVSSRAVGVRRGPFLKSHNHLQLSTDVGSCGFQGGTAW